MTRILFIRHGQTEWNSGGKFQGASDVPLAQSGLEQAERLAKYLSNEPISAVYSSKLTRAHQTASCIGAQFGLEVAVESGLEEISFGEWEGLTSAQIENKWPGSLKKFFADPEGICVPGGESFRSVQVRAEHAIRQIVARHAEQTVAVVSHGCTLRTLIASALHMQLSYVWAIKLDNTALSIVTYDKDNAYVELLNGIYHLSSEC